MSTPEIYRYDGENPPVKVGGVSALLPALVPISWQDFMNLPQEEQESGSYIVTNMPTLMNAYSLGYKDGLSAGQKLDQISSDLTDIGYTFHSRRLSNIPANGEVTSQVSDIYNAGGFIVSVNPANHTIPDRTTAEGYAFSLDIGHYGYDTSRKFCTAVTDVNTTTHTVIPSDVDILYALPMN